MLIDFTVENYRSIKDPVTLSAVAQKSSARKSAQNGGSHGVTPDQIASPLVVEGWGFGLLPVLAIFGANASGKSNILYAVDSLLIFMRTVQDTGLLLSDLFTPFLLSSSITTGQPSSSKFTLRTLCDRRLYSYTLELNQKRVLLEQLEYAPSENSDDILLYQRRWQSDRQAYQWENGTEFNGPHQQLQDSIDEATSYCSLLSRLVSIPIIEPLIDWLRPRSSGVSLGHEPIDHFNVMMRCWGDHTFLKRLSTLVNRFDTGVSRFEIKQDNQALYGAQLKVLAIHDADSGGSVAFPIGYESTGTQRLFELSGRILHTLDLGALMLIDELGSNIHPNICRELVSLFQSPKTNPKRAQLVFTSHDNTLQRDHLLRNDQIWFTQKRVDASTKLYSLSDFKVRRDAIDKAYLDGLYGAVPILPSEDELALITAGDE
jgi:hypothetical protein